LVSTAVLSKIMYIFNLHADIPIRLLVSVPSINIFMSTWTMVEPSEVDLSILSSGQTRKRSAGVHAILKVWTAHQKGVDADVVRPHLITKRSPSPSPTSWRKSSVERKSC
jgi:hypothetical protein